MISLAGVARSFSKASSYRLRIRTGDQGWEVNGVRQHRGHSLTRRQRAG
jgi:hypothetical protein